MSTALGSKEESEEENAGHSLVSQTNVSASLLILKSQSLAQAREASDL